MKKNISLIILMILLFTSCMGKEKMGFNTRDKMNLQMADRIVECINNEDVDGLYILFSEEVRLNDRTLKEDIEKIYHYLHGKVETYEKWAVGSTTDIEQGKNSTSYRSKFIIKINLLENFYHNVLLSNKYLNM